MKEERWLEFSLNWCWDRHSNPQLASGLSNDCASTLARLCALKRRHVRPVIEPEKGVVPVCSGSAQIAKLHDRNQKKGKRAGLYRIDERQRIVSIPMELCSMATFFFFVFFFCFAFDFWADFISFSPDFSLSVYLSPNFWCDYIAFYLSFQLFICVRFFYFSLSGIQPQIKQFCSPFFQVGEHVHPYSVFSSANVTWMRPVSPILPKCLAIGVSMNFRKFAEDNCLVS